MIAADPFANSELPLRVDSDRLAVDRTMRLDAQTAIIEDGFVHLPDEAYRLADTPSPSWAMLPARPGADQVDSASSERA